MSAAGATIQVRRVRPPWAAIVTLAIAFGLVGFVGGRVVERGRQVSTTTAAVEQAIPTSGLATQAEATRALIYQQIGELRSVGVGSPYRLGSGLERAKIYRALGHLDTVGAVTDPVIRRGGGATKAG